MRKYIFGPVPSRRLGLSLGVDLVPFKTCSLDCIYCECGATTNLTIERKEYVPIQDVIEELKEVLDNQPNINFVTFSGSGEPTLHSKISNIINFIKEKYPKLKICLLTNSTLLNEPKLIDDIKNIDLIIPSLDSAILSEFNDINRPHPEISLDTIINSLKLLKEKTSIEMWLEILVMPSINDNEDSFKKLKSAIYAIKPDKVQLNTLDRPGVFDNLTPVSEEKLILLSKILDDKPTVEIVAKFAYKQSKKQSKENLVSLEDKILEFISRRPCTKDDVLYGLGIQSDSFDATIYKLEKYNKIIKLHNKRGTFFKLSQ